MIIGITAEWNPFHLGHAYMVEHLKREYPDARLLAVMSGPFVQRGEPALFDKWAPSSYPALHSYCLWHRIRNGPGTAGSGPMVCQ